MSETTITGAAKAAVNAMVTGSDNSLDNYYRVVQDAIDTATQELRQRLANLEKPAINTNVRLFDLVRFMRAELHEAQLITDDEYTWLSADSPMASNGPGGGSPSPRRLEDYDELRQRLEAVTAKVEEQTQYTGTVCDKLAEAASERDEALQRVEAMREPLENVAMIRSSETRLSYEQLQEIAFDALTASTPPSQWCRVAEVLPFVREIARMSISDREREEFTAHEHIIVNSRNWLLGNDPTHKGAGQ